MGIVFRQSVKTSIVTITGAALGGIATYIYSHVLSDAEFGLVTSIIYAGALIQLVVMLGMPSTIAIYTQKYDTHSDKRKALLTIGLVVTLIVSSIFALLFFIFKDAVVSIFKPEDQTLISEYFFLIPVLIAIWASTTILDHYLIANVKIAISAFAREVLLRICNLTLLGLLFFDIVTIEQFIYGSVLIYLVPLIMLFIVSSRVEGFGFSTNLKAFTKKEYKDIIHFAWYHLLMVVSINALHYIDTLMLGPLDKEGIESIPAYRVAMYVATIMYIPFRGMATSSLPVLNDAYINNDHNKVSDLFTRAGVNTLIVSVAMFVLIALNLDNAVAILPEGYESVKPLVLILIIGKLIDMATGLNNELISISKYYKFNFWAAGLLLVMVYFLDRRFIPIYGTYGAAWVATGSLAVFNIMKMVYLYQKMKLHPFTNKSLLVVVAGLVAAGICYFIPYIYQPVVDAIVRSTAIVVIYTGMLLLLKPSEDLVVFLKNVKENKRLF